MNKITKLKYKASDVCQLFDKDKFFATRTAHGVVFTNNGDGSFTINGTCNSDADADTPLFLPPVDYSVYFDLYSIENHKYLLIPLPQAFSYSTLRFIFGSEATPYYETSDTYKVYTATKTGTYPCYAIYRVGKGTTINNLTVKPQLFDLTEMYGAGNEPTTVEEFRQKYPNELYPYSPQRWYPINKTRYMSNQYGNSVLTNSIDIYHNDAQKFFYIAGWSGATLYKRVASNVIPKIGLLDYKAVSNSGLYDGRSGDKTVSLGYPGMYDNFIMVRDLSFNGDTEKFKQFIIGNNVWFELETPTQGGYLPYTKLKYKASDVCQLLNKSKYPNKHTNNGVVFTSNDGVVTANGTASGSRALYYIVNVGNAILGHKYLLAGGVNNSCYIDGYIGATEHFGYDRGSGYIFTANASGKIQVSLNVAKDYTATNVMFKPQLFDLTEMYGAGNEPTTLAEFRQKYPNDLYPYSPQCWY